MNDLAEKALEGAALARRQVREHLMLTVGIVGFLLSAVVVVAGARVSAALATRPLTSWLYLMPLDTYSASSVRPATVLLAATCALVALWVATAEFVRRHPPAEGQVWAVAAAWGLPFVIGPPTLDTSVYTYAAFGQLQRAGQVPYHVAPSGLGSARILEAIDPAVRGVVSSTGPLGTLVQHLAVSISAGSALGAVLVLRGLGLLTAVWIGRLAADLAGVRRSQALTLTVLNPLVLFYVVSDAHLDGVMVALVLAAIVAANQRRWVLAMVLACLAGSVSGQGFVLVPMLVVVHWLARDETPTWLVVGRDVLVAAVTTTLAGLVVTDGFGWISTIIKQFSVHTPYALASGVSQLLTPVVRGASFDDLAAGGRVATLAAAASICCYLAATAGHRPLERTVGYALLAIGLLAPVLNPWYLLWGTLPLAATALGWRRTWVLVLCGTACLLEPPGFRSAVSNEITGVALVLAAGVVGWLYLRERRAVAEPAAVA